MLGVGAVSPLGRAELPAASAARSAIDSLADATLVARRSVELPKHAAASASSDAHLQRSPERLQPAQRWEVEEVKDRLVLLEDDVRALNQSLQSGSKLGLALRRTRSPLRDDSDHPGSPSTAASLPLHPGTVADRQVGPLLGGSLTDAGADGLRPGSMSDSLQQLQVNARLGQLGEQVELAMLQIAEERTQRRMEVAEAKLRLDAMEDAGARDEVAAAEAPAAIQEAEARLMRVAAEAAGTVDAAKRDLEELARAEAERAVAEIRGVAVEERPTLVVARAAEPAADSGAGLGPLVAELEARLNGRVTALEAQSATGATEARALMEQLDARLAGRVATLEAQSAAGATEARALVEQLDARLAGRVAASEGAAAEARALATELESRLSGRVASLEARGPRGGGAEDAELASRLAGLEERGSARAAEARELVSDLESRLAVLVASLEERTASRGAEMGVNVAQLDSRLAGRIISLEEQGMARDTELRALISELESRVDRHAAAVEPQASAEAAALVSGLESRLAERIASLETSHSEGAAAAARAEARLKKEEGRLAELASLVTVAQEDRVSALEQRAEEAAASGQACLAECRSASAQALAAEQGLDSRVREALSEVQRWSLSEVERRLSEVEAECGRLLGTQSFVLGSRSQAPSARRLSEESEPPVTHYQSFVSSPGACGGQPGGADHLADAVSATAAARAAAEAAAAEASQQASAAAEAAEAARAARDALQAGLAAPAAAAEVDYAFDDEEDTAASTRDTAEQSVQHVGARAQAKLGQDAPPAAAAAGPGAAPEEAAEWPAAACAPLGAAAGERLEAVEARVDARVEAAAAQLAAAQAAHASSLEVQLGNRLEAAKTHLGAAQAAALEAVEAQVATRLEEARAQLGAAQEAALEAESEKWRVEFPRLGAEVAGAASRLDIVERALQAGLLGGGAPPPSPGGAASAALRGEVDLLLEERASVRQHLEVLQAQADSHRAAADAEKSRGLALAESIRQSGDEHEALKRRVEEVAHCLDVERHERLARHQSLSESIEASLQRLLRKMDDNCAVLGQAEPDAPEVAAAGAQHPAEGRAAASGASSAARPEAGTASPMSPVRPALRAGAPVPWAGSATAPLPRSLLSLADDLAAEISVGRGWAPPARAEPTQAPARPAAAGAPALSGERPAGALPVASSASPLPSETASVKLEPSPVAPAPRATRGTPAGPCFRVLPASSLRPGSSGARVALVAGSPAPTSRLVAAEPTPQRRSLSPVRPAAGDPSPCRPGGSPARATRGASPVRQSTAAPCWALPGGTPLPVRVSVVGPAGPPREATAAPQDGAALAPEERARLLREIGELREVNSSLREERIELGERFGFQQHPLAGGPQGAPPAPLAPQAPPPPQTPTAGASAVPTAGAGPRALQALSVAAAVDPFGLRRTESCPRLSSGAARPAAPLAAGQPAPAVAPPAPAEAPAPAASPAAKRTGVFGPGSAALTAGGAEPNGCAPQALAILPIGRR